MRPLAAVACLALVSLAGCIGANDQSTLDTDSTGFDDSHLMMMPERRFEPELVLETEYLQIEQGTEVILAFNVTDVHDYDFPITFIDWNITYNREPNPVVEGDATMLPGTWNRTLYAEDWHTFTFNARDGQGFEDSVTIVVKVGDPVKKVVEEVVVGDEPTLTFIGTVAYPCTGGPGSLADVQDAERGAGAGCTTEAEECAGWIQGVNNLDCWWFSIEYPALWDQPFTTTGNDPDVLFYESCGHLNVEDGPPTSPEEAFGHLAPLLRPHKVGGYASVGTESGTIPAWTGCVVMYEYGGALGETEGGELSMTINMENEWDGDPWANVDEEGVCHAESYWIVDQRTVDGETVPPTIIYEHDRTGSMYSRSPLYSVWNDLWDGESGGSWLYQETNGIRGLQVGGTYPGPLAELGGDDRYADCVTPDQVLF